MNGHEQRQIDELKDDVRQLVANFNDFRIESKAGRTEIVGLIHTLQAEVQGEHNGLQHEVRANKLACDDSFDRSMQRIDALKANTRWWSAAAITAALTGIGAMVSGWAEAFFSGGK